MATFSGSLAQRGRAIALASATLLAATAPVMADDFAQKYGIPAECVGVGDKVAQLKCGTAYFKKQAAETNALRAALADKRGAAADKRGAAADKRGEAADARKAKAELEGARADSVISSANQETTCMKVIMNDLEKNGEKTANLNEPPKRGEACRTMKALGLAVGSSS